MPHFSDLMWVIVVAHCGTRGKSIDKSLAETCSPFGYGIDGGGFPSTGYPDMANSAALHMPIGFGPIIGITAGILLIVTILSSSLILFRNWHPWGALGSAVLLSFPVQLLLERGNLDGIIFILMSFSALCIAKRSTKFGIIAFVASFFSIGLKVFPAAGYAGWLITTPRWKSQTKPIGVLVKFIVLASLVIVLLISWNWIANERSNLIFSGGMNSFGLMASGYSNTSLLELLGSRLGRVAIWFMIFVKFLSLCFGFAISSKFRISELFHAFFDSFANKFQRHYTESYFLLMSWTWLGCYALTISYDYKHVFLIPNLFASLAIVSQKTIHVDPKQKLLLSAISIISFYVFYLPFAPLLYPIYKVPFLESIAEGIGEFIFIPIIAGSLAGTVIWSKSSIEKFKIKLMSGQ